MAPSSASISPFVIPIGSARIFAFGVNTQTSGVKDGLEQNPVFADFIDRAAKDYARLSPTPDQYDAFQTQIGKMWASEPNWTDAQLKAIKAPVLIVDGDHDEAIKREHTEYVAATIPGAGLLILPNVSHFAIPAGSRPVQLRGPAFSRRFVRLSGGG